MRRTSLLILILTLSLICGATAVMGQGVTPSLLNYQGLLADADGQPINAQGLVVTFRIWDDPIAANAANLKWEETLTIDVADGLFSVILGETVPITEDVFATSLSYLGLTIEGEPESTPRTRLVSVGYSSRVETVDGARGGVISGTVGVEENSGKGADEEGVRIELFDGDGVVRFWASKTEVFVPCLEFAADSSFQCTAAINSGAAQAISGDEVIVSTSLVQIQSHSINCPTDGFVMAMGSFEAEGNNNADYNMTLLSGITDTPGSLPADQQKRWTVYNGWEKTAQLHRNVISLYRIFPVTAGENSFYMLGQRTEGNHDFKISKSTMSLIFIPKAYGVIDGAEQDITARVQTPTGPAQMPVGGGSAQQFGTQLSQQAAEIAVLKAELAELKSLVQTKVAEKQ